MLPESTFDGPNRLPLLTFAGVGWLGNVSAEYNVLS